MLNPVKRAYAGHRLEVGFEAGKISDPLKGSLKFGAKSLC